MAQGRNILFVPRIGNARAASESVLGLLNPARRGFASVNGVRQFMRDNWLSNRVFTGHDDIVGLSCFYWNRLIEMPWRIMSIGLRDWAHRF